MSHSFQVYYIVIQHFHTSSPSKDQDFGLECLSVVTPYCLETSQNGSLRRGKLLTWQLRAWCSCSRNKAEDTALSFMTQPQKQCTMVTSTIFCWLQASDKPIWIVEEGTQTPSSDGTGSRSHCQDVMMWDLGTIFGKYNLPRPGRSLLMKQNWNSVVFMPRPLFFA